MIALPLVLYFGAAGLLFGGLRATGWSRTERLRWALAWAPAFAYGVPSCALFVTRWAGVDGLVPWLLVAGGLAGALAFATRRSRLAATSSVPPAARVAPTSRGGVALAVATAGLLCVSGALLLGSLRTWHQAQPQGMWDAVAIWNTGARFLARAEADRLPALVGAMREGHPEYPLHVAGAVAAQWGLAGRESSAIPLGMGLGFLLGLAAALHLLVRLGGAPLFAGPAVLLVLSTPAVWKWAFAQVADPAIAYLSLAAALPFAAALAVRPEPAPPAVLSGFVCGLLPWTKNEGTLFATALIGVFLVLAFVLRRRLGPWTDLWRRPLLFLGGALPPLIALGLFRLTWAPPGNTSFLRGDGKLAQLLSADRWRYVAQETLRAADPRTGDALWGFAWALLALGLLFWGGRLRWTRNPGAVLLLATATAVFASYCLAFVLSPADLHWHVGAALDRLMLQVLPLFAAGVFSLAGEPPPAPGRDVVPR